MNFGTLNGYRLVKISGIDAATFLQGQLTNDINLLDDQWQFTGYCNPKGRLLALLQLWKSKTNEFFALLSDDLADSVIKRLRMYVMRSKVEITVQEKSITAYCSVADLIAEHPALNHTTNLDNSSNITYLGDDQTLLRMQDRYLLINDQTSSAESFDLDWQAQNIDTGLPQINAATAELFVPQMVNLDLLDGINFKKGCYTGQEIVARLHYLGKTKQRMFVCQLNGNANDIKAGDKVYNNVDERKTVGNIVSAAQNHNLLLASLKLDKLDDGLYLEDKRTIQVIEPQPYSVPN